MLPTARFVVKYVTFGELRFPVTVVPLTLTVPGSLVAIVFALVFPTINVILLFASILSVIS